MKQILCAAAALVLGLAPTAAAQVASSSQTTSTAAATPTLSPWPCSGSTQTFALQMLAYDTLYYPDDSNVWDLPGMEFYNSTYLGVHSNGSQPAAAPVHNQTTALWYLDGSTLYVQANTTNNETALDNAAVVGTSFQDDDPFGGFWQNWIFDTSDAACEAVGGCGAVDCSIVEPSSQMPNGYPGVALPYGLLECSNGPKRDNEVFYPPQADAVVGSYDWEQEFAGYDTGVTCVTIYWEVVPSCLLPN